MALARSYAEYYGGGPSTIVDAVSGLILSELFIGDDYLAANGRALTWDVDIPPGTAVDSSECTLKFVQASASSTPLEIEFAGTITALSATRATLSFDLPTAITAAFLASEYRWFVTWVGDSGELITQVFNRQLVNWKNKAA